MIYWDNVDVIIGGSTGIMADGASLSSKNSLTPVYSIGNIGTHNIVPNGPIINEFSFSYSPLVNGDPNFDIANGIKELTNHLYTGVTIEVNGITGFDCRLKSLSYQIRPNDIVRANATYESFVNTSGDAFANHSYSGDYKNKNDIAHGWTTYFNTQSDYFEAPIYDLSYSFETNFSPRYTLGRKEAAQVSFLSATERVDIDQDTYSPIQFSGEDVFTSLLANNTSGLDFMTLNIVGYSEYDTGVKPFTGDYTNMTINLSGMKVAQSNVGAKINDILANKLSLIKYF